MEIGLLDNGKVMSFAFTEFLKLQKILTSVNRSISDFGVFTFANSCARF